MPVLDAILAATRATLPELRARAAELERQALAAPLPVPFTQGMSGAGLAVIAEVKRRSPSAGAINPGLDPVELATAYQHGGAHGISVLTDREFFGGSLDDLRSVTGAVNIPVLRKDFLLDRIQLCEARIAGASAVLLIARALDQTSLRELASDAAALGLDVLVEIHNAAELERALEVEAAMIGVNSRDLDDFSIDRSAAWRLLSRIPSGRIAVAESGMATLADVTEAAAAGADAVLIGGALAAAPDPQIMVRQFSEVVRRGR